MPVRVGRLAGTYRSTSRAIVVLGAAALGGGLLAVACHGPGGGSPVAACLDVFTGCAATPATLAETETCTALLDGPCGNAALIFRTCVAGKCTDAGFTDNGGVLLSCYDQQTSLEACLAAQPDGSAGPGDSSPSGDMLAGDMLDPGEGDLVTRDGGGSPDGSAQGTTGNSGGPDGAADGGSMVPEGGPIDSGPDAS